MDESYSFIKETRKKKPEDKSVWIRRGLILCGMAVGAGILAALVFVLSVPVFQNLLGKTPDEPEKIEMSAVTASSSEENEEEEKAKTEDKAETVRSPEDEQKEAMNQFRKVYQEMMDTAKAQQASMTEVIGITSQMDYFNHNYENRQSVSGLLVAESQSVLYCLTENRGLKKAEKIQVIFGDGSKVTAELKATDSETGLAILSINRSDIRDDTWNYIEIARFCNSNSLRMGIPVIAVGSVSGMGDSMEYGIITSMNNTISFWDTGYNVLTTDMIGNSAGSGVLINLQGEVVGIINQNLGEESQNLITAIPVKQLNALIEDMINGKAQIRIGIKGQAVSSDISAVAGIPRGLLVSAVDQESPAMYAGIKELDVITAVDGVQVDDLASYQRAVAALAADQEVKVEAMRMGKENYEEITFRLKPETK
ncbi:MAG: PDZ domain-containing protein [Lachnospiraceae bacterium]|nr:PDZ domain-containing protein [Lachnospiraceae bacterium]